MLNHNGASSSFSVDDIPKAKAFYTETLNLEVSEQNGMLDLHIGNGSKVLVYPKSNHSAASFTILNFSVVDIEQAIDELAQLGVRFEHYPEMNTNEKGIFEVKEMGLRQAWFKDPAGNILSLIETT